LLSRSLWSNREKKTIKQAITIDSLKDYNITAVNLIKPFRHCFAIEYARLAITQPIEIRETR